MGNMTDEEYLIDKELEGCEIDELGNEYLLKGEVEEAIKDALMHWEKIGEYDEDLYNEILTHIDGCTTWQVTKATIIE